LVFCCCSFLLLGSAAAVLKNEEQTMVGTCLSIAERRWFIYRMTNFSATNDCGETNDYPRVSKRDLFDRSGVWFFFVCVCSKETNTAVMKKKYERPTRVKQEFFLSY
jgi:hypothetical protein